MAGFVGARPGRRRLSTFLIVCQRATSRFVRITSARRGLVARAGAMRSLVRMCRFFGCAKACSIGARAAEKTRFALLCAAPLGAKGEAPTRRGADATPESPCVRRAACGGEAARVVRRSERSWRAGLRAAGALECGRFAGRAALVEV